MLGREKFRRTALGFEVIPSLADIEDSFLGRLQGFFERYPEDQARFEQGDLTLADLLHIMGVWRRS